jgi:hypothetical protein
MRAHYQSPRVLLRIGPPGISRSPFLNRAIRDVLDDKWNGRITPLHCGDVGSMHRRDLYDD